MRVKLQQKQQVEPASASFAASQILVHLHIYKNTSRRGFLSDFAPDFKNLKKRVARTCTLPLVQPHQKKNKRVYTLSLSLPPSDQA
jgi:hypothetical protein